jgi:Uma2 family endonuclease
VAHPVKKPASYEDLLALPEHVVGELVGGELHVAPRPSPRHAKAASLIGVVLGGAYQLGNGGPGGWIILDEPELHLRRDVLVPDLAGWRRERMPEVPTDLSYVVLSPDWICEILSPSTAMLDRTKKLQIYAREQVPHVWFIEPIGQTLEVFRLDGDTYRIASTAGGDDKVRAEPFDAIELDLAILWAR